MRAFGEEAKKNRPAGIEYKIAYKCDAVRARLDSGRRQDAIEAVGLVILIVFAFLQDWRCIRAL